jgi:hypothetical protein
MNRRGEEKASVSTDTTDFFLKQRHNLLYHILNGQAIGIELNGVVGFAQGGHPTAAVFAIAVVNGAL